MLKKAGLFLLLLILGLAFFLVNGGGLVVTGIFLLTEPEMEDPPLLVAAPPPPPPMGYNQTLNIPVDKVVKPFGLFFHLEDKIYQHATGVEAWILRLEDLGESNLSTFSADDVTPEWLVEHGEKHQANDQGYLYLEKEPGSLFLWAKNQSSSSKQRFISTGTATTRGLIFVSMTESEE